MPHELRTMKHLNILPLAFAAILVSSCSTSKWDAQMASDLHKLLTPIYEISLLGSGAIDIIYCSGSFRHKNDRWPRDYAELSEFVKQSDGYLMLGEYERVDLKPLLVDKLEILYVRHGQTNEHTFILESP